MHSKSTKENNYRNIFNLAIFGEIFSRYDDIGIGILFGIWLVNVQKFF